MCVLNVEIFWREIQNGHFKILFWADNTTKKSDRSAAEMAVTEEELQTLQPPKDELHGSAFRLVVVRV